MNKIFKIIICCILIISIFSCKRNKIYDKPLELSAEEINKYLYEQNIIKEKFIELMNNIEIDKENSDQILPDEYISIYGRTKDEIINNLGNNYLILKQEKIPEEYGWGYNLRENIGFSGINFEILLNDETSKINYFIVTGGNIKYVGNIFVGCTIADVINQLGKPTYVGKVTNNFVYFSQNIRIAFNITHEGKIKNISVSDYTESYNLDFNPKHDSFP